MQAVHSSSTVSFKPMTHVRLPLRVAVTGASGFIGRALCTYLVGCGHSVLALSRAPQTIHAVQCAQVPSYTDVKQLTDLLHGCDVVIHLAALAHRNIAGGASAAAAAFAANVDATQATALASAAAGVRRFVLISSIGVNGQSTDTVAFDEVTPPQPTEPYAVSKWQCELALRDVVARHAGLEFVTIRPPLVYGPDAPGNFSQLLQAVARRSLLPLGAVANQRSFIGVENLVNFIELCAHHPSASNQIYLISDGEDVSTPEFIRRIGQALGTPARLMAIPLPLLRLLAGLLGRDAQVARLVASLQVNSGKARSQLAWGPPVSLDEGLRRAVQGAPSQE